MKSKRLASYSILSAAFLLIDNDVSGQVWYTDFLPDTIVTSTVLFDTIIGPCSSFNSGFGIMPFDLNNDGIDDLGISVNYRRNDWCGYHGSKGVIEVKMYGLNRVAWTNTYSYGDLAARKLPDGFVVDGALNFTGTAAQTALIQSHDLDTYGFGYDYGSWAYGQGAMGLQINIGGVPYYGWMRLKNISTKGREILVLDHMLSAIPGDPITVGENYCQRPFDLEVTPVSSSSVLINWQSVHNAERYQIRARELGSSSFSSGSSFVNSKVVNSLMPATTYEWQVRARCTDGTMTPFSEIETFTTPVLLEGSRPDKPGLPSD